MTAVKEKKTANPGSKSFEVVKEATTDLLIKCKLCFFQCVAGHLLPFLTLYQTDKPMVVCLGSDLSNLIRALMRRFVKDDILTAASTDEKLVKIDIDDKKNHKACKQIDVGFSTEKELKAAVKKDGVSEKQVMEFRIDSRKFLISTLKNILMKCPLIYWLVRNMSALDPREMANNRSGCGEKMKKVLNVLVK